MFDEYEDNDTPWQESDAEKDMPKMMTIAFLRDKALEVFNGVLAQQAGLKKEFFVPEINDSHRAYLSLKETEAIVESFSAIKGAPFMAIGGNSKAEAMQQVQNLMQALMTRIMSNVIAEGVKQDLIDSAFDSEKNDFVFGVTPKGMDMCMKLADQFEGVEDSDENADEEHT